MCPRTKSIIIALAMVFVSLLIASLIATQARMDSGSNTERAIRHESQQLFSEMRQSGLAEQIQAMISLP